MDRLPIVLGAAVATLIAAVACGRPGMNDRGSQPRNPHVYHDGRYEFTLNYPADFIFRSQPTEKLAKLEPRPAAAFFIMSTATSDPADLELRVYGIGRTTSLERWLTANGLLPADSKDLAKPFQTAHVSGIEVCASTMIAPGCSYFVHGNSWIYQLTPASVEGEKIVRTFAA